MTSRDFCYWLQGLFELGNVKTGLDVSQMETIKRHLSMVFKHEIDPSMGDVAHQNELSDIHSAPYKPKPPRPSDTRIRC